MALACSWTADATTIAEICDRAYSAIGRSFHYRVFRRNTPLSETDLTRLYLAVHLVPETMPPLSVFQERLTPQESAFVKRILDTFYEGRDISERDRRRFNQIIEPILELGKSEGGGYPALTYGWYKGEKITISLPKQSTGQQKRLANTLGLPLFTGGRMSISGSREHTGRLTSDFDGYHEFFDEQGKRFLSLNPIDGATPEEIMRMYKFIKKHTNASGLIARPLGIHFYHGKPRILFEPLTARVPDQLADVPEPLKDKVKDAYEGVITRAAGRGFRAQGKLGYDYPLEHDYLFLDETGLRIGLPVRAREFARKVEAGEIFQLKP